MRVGVGDAQPGNGLDSVATRPPEVEDALLFWNLRPSERSRFANIGLGEEAISDVVQATEHMLKFLKPESIADVVRRRGDAVGGISLVSLLLDGKTERVLEACLDMFRFENVYG